MKIILIMYVALLFVGYVLAYVEDNVYRGKTVQLKTEL